MCEHIEEMGKVQSPSQAKEEESCDTGGISGDARLCIRTPRA